jgi:hypothetical protein
LINRFPVFLFLGILVASHARVDAESLDLLLVRITPQVVEHDQTVSWQQELSKVTRAGNPVVVNIDAAPLVIRVTVTPFIHGKDFLLVVQGDVKQMDASGTRRSTTLQSLLVPPGETIVFFPLGRAPGDIGHQMVVRMQVEPQGE